MVMVRPWKEFNSVMMLISALAPYLSKLYFRATLMAPSLASAPELAKNTRCHAGALAEALAASTGYPGWV